MRRCSIRSAISIKKEFDLVKEVLDNNMGFIAMKSLAGGLITDSRAAMAFVNEHEGVLPIWGIQKESELDEWLSYMHNTPEMDDEIRSVQLSKRTARSSPEISCRGCGYCMATCPMELQISTCARMGLMLRRAPSQTWLSEYWQEEMKKAENCIRVRSLHSQVPVRT